MGSRTPPLGAGMYLVGQRTKRLLPTTTKGGRHAVLCLRAVRSENRCHRYMYRVWNGALPGALDKGGDSYVGRRVSHASSKGKKDAAKDTLQRVLCSISVTKHEVYSRVMFFYWVTSGVVTLIANRCRVMHFISARIVTI